MPASRLSPARPSQKGRMTPRNCARRRLADRIEQPSYIFNPRGYGVFLQVAKLLVPLVELAMQPI
jgi:hypothetical protein